MEFFRKLNVDNRRTVLLLVIEGFFQFKGYDYLSLSIWITKFLYVLFLNSLMSMSSSIFFYITQEYFLSNIKLNLMPLKTQQSLRLIHSPVIAHLNEKLHKKVVRFSIVINFDHFVFMILSLLLTHTKLVFQGF